MKINKNKILENIFSKEYDKPFKNIILSLQNNKIIDFKVHNDIFHSDHFPISLKISTKRYHLRNKIKVEYID